jgi:flagellar motor switch protein FliN
MPSQDNGQQSGVRNSLGSDEIKAVLQAARDNVQMPANDVSDADFEPGDIQYLRGVSTPKFDVSNAELPPLSWRQMPTGPEKLLETAERHIAQAIMDSSSSAPAATARTNSTMRQADSGMKQIPSQGLTLEDLGDLDLDITIELGRSEILIEDVLKLREGSVVTLDKRAGDPVDIFANGRLIARGELLVIDGKFGVRLSEVL